MARPGNSFRLGHPRHNPMPSEPEIYYALAEGRSEDEIASSHGMSPEALRNYIRVRQERWALNPPGRLVDDDRRIVVRRETYVGHAYRTVIVSLPRISMHVAAREEARRHG